MSKSSIDRVFPYVKKGLTGTGAPQSIAHSLGVVPDIVIPIQRSGNAAVTLGTHTSTNIVITVANGVVYDLLAGVIG